MCGAKGLSNKRIFTLPIFVELIGFSTTVNQLKICLFITINNCLKFGKKNLSLVFPFEKEEKTMNSYELLVGKARAVKVGGGRLQRCSSGLHITRAFFFSFYLST